MNRPIYYRPFRKLIRQLINEKISRGLFIIEWREQQEKQGLVGPKELHVDDYKEDETADGKIIPFQVGGSQ